VEGRYHPGRARPHRDEADVRSTVGRYHRRAGADVRDDRPQAFGILAEDGFLEAVSPPGERGTRYKRAPRSVVLERAQQILDSVDTETLSARVAELRETVREFEERTGTESPSDAAVADAEVDLGAVTEWQTARRNLKLARAALALADAEETIGDDATGEHGEPAGLLG
jgi:hypothetical protein